MLEVKNEIFVMPFDVWLLKSSFSRINGEMEKVLKNDQFIVLKQLDFVFQPLNPLQISRITVVDGGTTISNQIDYSYGRTIKDWIYRDFDQAKPIEGFKVLNLRTFDKLWICGYDMANLVNFLNKNENIN